MSDEFTHYYAWRNKPERKLWKDMKCKILLTWIEVRCLVRFEDGGLLYTNRGALRKIKGI